MRFNSLYCPTFLILLFAFPPVGGEDIEQLQKEILQKREVTAPDFGNSINSLLFEKETLNDTLKYYFEWLSTNEQYFLADSNAYFKVNFLLELAKANLTKNNHRVAYQNIDKALQLVVPKRFPEVYFKINKFGALVANDVANYQKAIEYNENIIGTKELFSDSLLVHVYLAISNGYLNLCKYDRSMYYCTKAYPILHNKKSNKGMIALLLNMYNNSRLCSTDSARTGYLNRAIEIAKKSDDSILISNTYFEFGKSLYWQNNIEDAIKTYQAARNYLNDSSSNRDIEIAIYQHVGYTSLPDSSEIARELLDYILTGCLKNNDKKTLSYVYLSKVNDFTFDDNPDSVEYYLDRSEQYLTEYGNPDATPGYYYKMYKVSMKAKHYQRALVYLQKTLDEQKRISQQNNSSELSIARAQFDYQVQKDKIEELQSVNQFQKEKNLRQKIGIWGMALLTMIGVMFLLLSLLKDSPFRFSFQKLILKNIEPEKQSYPITYAEALFQGKRNRLIIKDEELIYTKLKILLEKERIYKDPNLCIRSLAERLNTNTSYLSSIVNDRFGESFKALLNRYRINEAVRILVSNKFTNYSVEGIAHEVGYQSRSTFYQVFRQVTGMTPTEYVEIYSTLNGNPKNETLTRQND